MELNLNHSSNIELDLREYQYRAIDEIRDGMRKGIKAQILSLPTGAGKTIVALGIIKSAIEKNKRVAFLCDRNTLVQQTSDRLTEYNIPHGILQGANTRDLYHNIVVCSLQTVEARGSDLGEFHLLIVDECHSQREQMNNYIKKVKPYLVGLTATPFSEGLGTIYQRSVCTRTTGELIEQNFLVPMRVFHCTQVDTKGVAKMSNGEWQAGEIGKRILAVRGNIVAEWCRRTYEVFGRPVKTLVFAATVADGEALCKEFRDNGYNFQQVSYKHNSDDNKRKIREFHRPNSAITGLINTDMLVKGFDAPDVECIISARPYRKSLTSVLQFLGRGLRIFPGKQFCLLLDHAGNFEGFFDQIMSFWTHGPPVMLNDKAKEFARQTRSEDKKRVRCNCGYVFQPSDTQCPMCGTAKPKPDPRYPVYEDGHMSEMKADPRLKSRFKPGLQTWNEICAIAMAKKEAWGDEELTEKARKYAYAKYRQMFGFWPRGNFNPHYYKFSDELNRYLKHLDIKYLKAKERQRQNQSIGA